MPAVLLAANVPPPVVGPKTRVATRPTEKLPQWLIDEVASVKHVPFNPKEHLNFVPPSTIHTMAELGLEGAGISNTAATEPFSLFTPEAILQMRAELFSKPVLDSCQYASDFAKNMIRGFGPALAPFIFEAWNHPETLQAISSVAGIDLVPALEFDVGHVNISINVAAKEISVTHNNDGVSTPQESAFAWHRDSFAFVCVTMLSDCTGMVGGETMIRKPSGELMKVRGPSQGTAVVMQGRYLEHQALKSTGGRERISMVTSFRPRSALVKDESILTGVRGISEVSRLYKQYSQYRLEILDERIKDQLARMKENEGTGQFDAEAIKHFMDEQRIFIESTMAELI